MSDAIDDLMTARFPGIKAEVVAGLATKPSLTSYITVTPTSEITPYRIRKARWVDQQLYGLTTFDPELDVAYRFTRSCALPIVDLQDAFAELRTLVRGFATDVRAAERQTVLQLVAESTPPDHTIHDCTEVTVEEAATFMGGTCRLVSSGALAEACKKKGIVSEAVDGKADLPTGIEGLLVRVDNGPTLARLTDDLTPTWRRGATPNQPVILTLEETFFLERPSASFAFLTRRARR